MFKNMTSELTGSSDICHALGPDTFNNDPLLAFLLPGETAYFMFKSTKEAHIFTNLAYISLKGQSAVNTRRFVDRYEYSEGGITNVCFETAGASLSDRDVELKFTTNTGVCVSIDIWKKEFDVALGFYKKLVMLSLAQAKNRALLMMAQASLGKVTCALAGAEPGALAQSIRVSAEGIYAAYAPASYREVFEQH